MTPRNPKSTTARIYCRVSTQKQGRSGLGLEAQEEIGRAKASELGLTVVEVVVEVESGRKSRTGRPALRKATADCKIDGSVLIIAKLDRLSRNFNFMIKVTEAAERDGIGIVACDVPDLSNPSTSKFLWRILAAVAELEADQTSERTKVALKAARKRGVTLGNPQSQKSSKIARKRFVHDTIKYAHDTVMPRVEEIHKLGVFSLQGIARELNARHVPTYQAHLMDMEVSTRDPAKPRPLWSAETVKRAIANAKKPIPKINIKAK